MPHNILGLIWLYRKYSKIIQYSSKTNLLKTSQRRQTEMTEGMYKKRNEHDIWHAYAFERFGLKWIRDDESTSETDEIIHYYLFDGIDDLIGEAGRTAYYIIEAALLAGPVSALKGYFRSRCMHKLKASVCTEKFDFGTSTLYLEKRHMFRNSVCTFGKYTLWVSDALVQIRWNSELYVNNKIIRQVHSINYLQSFGEIR